MAVAVGVAVTDTVTVDPLRQTSPAEVGGGGLGVCRGRRKEQRDEDEELANHAVDPLRVGSGASNGREAVSVTVTLAIRKPNPGFKTRFS